MTSPYSWVITKDFLANEITSITGPRDSKMNVSKIIEEGEEFQMFDDDGILYYEGFITGDYDGFEPLDDYGTPDSGCTEIRYKNKDGIWETL